MQQDEVAHMACGIQKASKRYGTQYLKSRICMPSPAQALSRLTVWADGHTADSASERGILLCAVPYRKWVLLYLHLPD